MGNVFGTSILVALLVGPVSLLLIRYLNHKKRFTERLSVHKSRLRKVYGCVNCGEEQFPGEKQFVCTACREELTYCPQCHEKVIRGRLEGITKPKDHDFQSHKMEESKIWWEVSVNSISSARSSAEAMRCSFELYAERDCLGKREILPTGSLADTYRWLSYADVYLKAERVGQWLADYGGCQRGKVVLLFGAASVEWYLAQYACFLYGYIVVPVHASATAETLSQIFQRAKPTAIFCSRHLQSAVRFVLAENAKRGAVEDPVCVLIRDTADPYAMRQDPKLSDERKESNEVFFGDVLGQMEKFVPTRTQAQFVPSPETVVMLLPTSGSSGVPKLTIVTENMIRTQATPPRFGIALVMLSFEPLRQSIDVLVKGGRIGVFSGSLSHLSDDLRICRPTIFGATPVFFSGLHQQYLTELQREKAKASSAAASREETADENRFRMLECETRLQREWQKKAVLGNRCKMVIVGGAGTSAELRKWMFDTLQCVVTDGYGTTETGGLVGNSDTRSGATLLLIDALEFGYLTSDKPFPRGEIVAHTERMTPGYYGDEEATAESFVKIGSRQYFRTGDIGEMRDGGKIHIIDRKKALFKLAQGVFVAPQPLEQIFQMSDLVKQVFVYGEAEMHSVCVAVIPANSHVTEEQILKAFRELAVKAHRAAWEIPSRVFIERELEWTADNGLLSSIGKLCRPVLKTRYAPKFKAMMQSQTMLKEEEAAVNRNISVVVSHSASSPSEIADGIRVAILSSLPSLKERPNHALKLSDSLSDLGADSMAYARLSNTLKERFGVEIPLPVLVKMTSLAQLQTAVLSGGTDLGHTLEPTPAAETAKPDEGSKWMAEADAQFIECERLISEAMTNRHVITNDSDREAIVILTGSTGFFGAFLLRALLLNTAAPYHKAKIVCCGVRVKEGVSDAHTEAVRRVRENFLFYRLSAPADFNDRVICLAGDLAQPQSNLQDLLSKKRVLAVFHNAAEVNSAKSYAALRGPNVTATSYMLAVAAQTRAEFHHISTIGLLACSGILSETGSVPPSCLSLLSGYAQSKWVAEQMVIRSARRGLVRVKAMYRPGTLAADSETGASNLSDSVCRMIMGLAREGLYCTDHDSPLPQRFTMAPVDWAANALVRLAEKLSSSEKQTTLKESPPVFHLVSRTPLPLEAVANALRTEADIPMKSVSAAVFRARMSELPNDEHHPLFMFRSTLSQAGFASASVDALPLSDNVLSLLKEECPPFTAKMLLQMYHFCNTLMVK